MEVFVSGSRTTASQNALFIEHYPLKRLALACDLCSRSALMAGNSLALPASRIRMKAAV